MRSTSWLLLLSMSMMLLAFTSAMAAAENPVIVGKWDRTDGADKYTIYADGVTETVLPDGTHRGTWEYDGSGGYKYIFHWEHSPPGQEPFIDYVTVADDGQSYSGTNNYGDHFNCVRVSYDTDSASTANSGFPLLYVAVGGGIAAAVVVGAAVYVFYAGKTASEAAAAASELEASGALPGTASSTNPILLAENDKPSPAYMHDLKAGKPSGITSEFGKPFQLIGPDGKPVQPYRPESQTSGGGNSSGSSEGETTNSTEEKPPAEDNG
jgi:hypothetical protein